MLKSLFLGILCALLVASGSGASAAVVASQAVSTPELPDEVTAFSLRPANAGESELFNNVEVEPGGAVTLELVVRNLGTDEVTVRVYRANASNPPNGGFSTAMEDEAAVGATEWLQFAAQEVTLQVGDAQILPFSIAVPADAEPGQYVSSFVAEGMDPTAIPGVDNVAYRLRFAMPVSILVPGELHHSFELGDPILEENTIHVPIENTGNYRVRPEGELVVANADGDSILTVNVAMESVYAGNATTISIPLQSPLPGGTFTVSTTLTDPDSGAETELVDAPLEIAEVEVEEAIIFSVTSASIAPNADPIAFANVEVAMQNDGTQISSTEVLLLVYRDGELVEEFPLATNQIMVEGENVYTSRYIPAEAWEPGTYTFGISVTAADPTREQQMELLNEPRDAEIVVP